MMDRQENQFKNFGIPGQNNKAPDVVIEKHEDDAWVTKNEKTEVDIKNIADESTHTEDSSDLEESADEYIGPKAHEYTELSQEEIAERYPEYNKEFTEESSVSPTDTQAEIVKVKEKKRKYGFNSYKTSSELEAHIYKQYDALRHRDNLKTMPENKIARGWREKIRNFLDKQSNNEIEQKEYPLDSMSDN